MNLHEYAALLAGWLKQNDNRATYKLTLIGQQKLDLNTGKHKHWKVREEWLRVTKLLDRKDEFYNVS